MAAIRHGRGEEALLELENLVTEMERMVHGSPELWALLLELWSNRVAVLVHQDRCEEAEAEAIARENLTRVDEVTADELRFILARSLNGQGRYEEAWAEVRRLDPVGRTDSGRVDLAEARALHGRVALTPCFGPTFPAWGGPIQRSRVLSERSDVAPGSGQLWPHSRALSVQEARVGRQDVLAEEFAVVEGGVQEDGQLREGLEVAARDNERAGF